MEINPVQGINFLVTNMLLHFFPAENLASYKVPSLKVFFSRIILPKHGVFSYFSIMKRLRNLPQINSRLAGSSRAKWLWHQKFLAIAFQLQTLQYHANNTAFFVLFFFCCHNFRSKTPCLFYNPKC